MSIAIQTLGTLNTIELFFTALPFRKRNISFTLSFSYYLDNYFLIARNPEAETVAVNSRVTKEEWMNAVVGVQSKSISDFSGCSLSQRHGLCG